MHESVLTSAVEAIRKDPFAVPVHEEINRSGFSSGSGSWELWTHLPGMTPTSVGPSPLKRAVAPSLR